MGTFKSRKKHEMYQEILDLPDAYREIAIL